MFWLTQGSSKPFYCPFDLDLFSRHVPSCAPVLDYGCGYGRLSSVLSSAGFDVTGADPSVPMLQRARLNAPSASFRRIPLSYVPFGSSIFEGVILYSVLSSVISSSDRASLLGELRRVLKPGGILYIHDFAVQTDPPDAARYARGYTLGRERYGDAVFVDDDQGFAFKHFDERDIIQLSSGMEVLALRRAPARSMNGGTWREAFQLMVRK